MFEFIIGYALGASQDDTTVSWRSIGTFLLVLMAICGVGWLVIAGIEPVREVEQCGGTAITAFACELAANATKIGVLLLGTAAVIVSVWGVIIILAKK